MRSSSFSTIAGKNSTDSIPAATSDAALIGFSSPSSTPICVATTMNDRDVACNSADGTSSAGSRSRRNTSTGSPRAISNIAKKSGTRSTVDQSENSWSTGNDRPVATKKIGTKNPKPMPSSLWRTCPNSSSRAGSVTADRSAPARNEPRMASNPSPSLTTSSEIISNIAIRTRSCALLSCRRSST